MVLLAYVQADVSDADASAALVEAAVGRFGRLDVLVNNAGMTKVIPHPDLDAVTDEVFRDIFEVNVLGTLRLTRLALPHLKATGDGGRGQRDLDRRRAAHRQLDPLRHVQGGAQPHDRPARPGHRARGAGQRRGPGPGPHAVDRRLGPHPRRHKDAAPLGRSAEPDDIAARVVDVAASPYLTGQVVVVDGGLSLR